MTEDGLPKMLNKILSQILVKTRKSSSQLRKTPSQKSEKIFPKSEKFFFVVFVLLVATTGPGGVCSFFDGQVQQKNGK